MKSSISSKLKQQCARRLLFITLMVVVRPATVPVTAIATQSAKMEKTFNATITVTNRCNLHCIYCYEKNKSDDCMSVETAKIIVDALIEECFQRGSFDKINIQFFGGEPFLNFPVIKATVEYVQESYPSFPVHFLVTTNGTQMTDETKRWLTSYKDLITCGLSLDGKEKTHNMNRSNSFSLIDVSFFKNTWPQYPIKMTISPQSLPNFAEDVIWLHESGFKIKCNLAVGIDWSVEEYVTTFQKQLNILADYYISHPYLELCSLLDFNMNKIGLVEKNTLISKYCGIGTSMCAYDVQGRRYPCQFFCENTLGIPFEEVKNISIPKKYPASTYNHVCSACILIQVCPNCYGANYQIYGDCFCKDLSMCKMTKIAAFASSYIKAKRFLNHPEQDHGEAANYFNGILAIQKEFG